MNSSKQPDILPEPPGELKQHSDRLVQAIVSRIERSGAISFADYMQMALYEPGLGYYSAGLHKFGAEGDFVTAPELGDIFAACLARQIAQATGELGACNILEIGAGSGKLASDLMSELEKLDLEGEAESRPHSRAYRILETSADLREVQRKTIEEQRDWEVSWLDSPPDQPWSGIIIANEVVDALPVERFSVADEQVFQICVTAGDNGLQLDRRPAPVELEEAVRQLGPLPDNYCSEICLQLPAWLESVSAGLDKGIIVFADYGYPQHEFYLPERRDGTLIANYRHRAHDDVLRYPGLQDLTSFVNFSALADAGLKAGLDLLGYTSQALFLMGSGLDEVVHERLSGDAGEDIATNNQVRFLVHPELMGEKFQVMAFGRGWRDDRPLRGFSFRDLSSRL